MSNLITAYIATICASGVMNLFLCAYAFIKRHTYSSISTFFILYVLSITIYCFASATGLLATNIEQVKFWTVFQYIGIAISPALGLLFVLKYVGIGVSKKRVIAILTIPIITVLMVATNDYHHLHYRMIEIDPQLGAPFVEQVEGFWYMIHGIFSFGYMFAAFLIACSRWKETNSIYRPQLLTLIIGQILPIIVIFLYLISATPLGIDPLPMVYWLTSLLYLWAIKSSRLLAIMPIAKNTIFNNMNDGVIVLDETKQLIEYNNAFQLMFPQMNKNVVGQNFYQLWFTLTGETFKELFLEIPLTKNIVINTMTDKKIYQIRISLLQNGKKEKGYLLIFTDITELTQLQLQLQYQANYDELTQIYNRRAFFEHSEKDYMASTKNTAPFTIILLDIDYFKKINDTYGHHIGDDVLVHVVETCKKILPEGALFGRYGGEEFVIALNGYDALVSEEITKKICMTIAQTPFYILADPIHVTVSAGVAHASYDYFEALHQLLMKADQALYQAKESGRNRVVVYNQLTIFSKQ